MNYQSSLTIVSVLEKEKCLIFLLVPTRIVTHRHSLSSLQKNSSHKDSKYENNTDK